MNNPPCINEGYSCQKVFVQNDIQRQTSPIIQLLINLKNVQSNEHNNARVYANVSRETRNIVHILFVLVCI